MINIKKDKRDKGFTLVELIVSLGLFMFVMTISTTALLSLTDINRKVQSTRIAFDNLNLALESISREIRMGMFYNCGETSFVNPVGIDCASTGLSSIAFVSQDDRRFVYQQNGNTLERSTDNGSNFSTITSPEIIIDDIKFYVFGTALSDSPPEQPRVIISIKGTAGVGDTQSSFNMQTSVTQRMPGF